VFKSDTKKQDAFTLKFVNKGVAAYKNKWIQLLAHHYSLFFR
jgi:hypothetical protein